MPITLEITMRNKKIYPIKKKFYVKKFPNKKLDFPNLKGQKELRFYFSWLIYKKNFFRLGLK